MRLLAHILQLLQLFLVNKYKFRVTVWFKFQLAPIANRFYSYTINHHKRTFLNLLNGFSVRQLGI